MLRRVDVQRGGVALVERRLHVALALARGDRVPGLVDDEVGLGEVEPERAVGGGVRGRARVGVVEHLHLRVDHGLHPGVLGRGQGVVGDDVEDGADVHRAVRHPRLVLEDAVGVGLVVGVELGLLRGAALGDPGRAGRRARRRAVQRRGASTEVVVAAGSGGGDAGSGAQGGGGERAGHERTCTGEPAGAGRDADHGGVLLGRVPRSGACPADVTRLPPVGRSGRLGGPVPGR